MTLAGARSLPLCVENCGAQDFGYAGGGFTERVGEVGEEQAALFLGAAAYGEDADSGGCGGGEGGGCGGDAAAGGDEVEFGEPVACRVGDVGFLVEAGPDAHEAVLARGRAGDPALAAQF